MSNLFHPSLARPDLYKAEKATCPKCIEAYRKAVQDVTGGGEE